jgi:hypothetical protein
MLRAAAYSFLLRPWRAAIAFSAFSLAARPDTRELRAGEGAADTPRTLLVSMRFPASGARWLPGRSADSVLASFGEAMVMVENWRCALPGKEQTWRDTKDALGITFRAANMYASAQEISSINAPRGAVPDTIFWLRFFRLSRALRDPAPATRRVVTPEGGLTGTNAAAIWMCDSLASESRSRAGDPLPAEFKFGRNSGLPVNLNAVELEQAQPGAAAVTRPGRTRTRLTVTDRTHFVTGRQK